MSVERSMPAADAQVRRTWCARGLQAFGTPTGSRLLRLTLAWLGLVGVAVIGRLVQPAWNVTPMTAVALVAGAVFPGTLAAASVPLAALALGNLLLPSYESLSMAAVVGLATAFPVLLRSWVRSGSAWSIAAGGLVGAVVFFLSTNVAYWWLSTDYPHTIGGLIECFFAALPFFRWMPVGDVAWSLGLAHAVAAAGHRLAGREFVAAAERAP